MPVAFEITVVYLLLAFIRISIKLLVQNILLKGCIVCGQWWSMEPSSCDGREGDENAWRCLQGLETWRHLRFDFLRAGMSTNYNFLHYAHLLWPSCAIFASSYSHTSGVHFLKPQLLPGLLNGTHLGMDSITSSTPWRRSVFVSLPSVACMIQIRRICLTALICNSFEAFPLSLLFVHAANFLSELVAFVFSG